MASHSNDLFNFGVPYIKEKLSREEEYDLVRRYKNDNDELAFQKLLGAHAMAIRASVRKFTRGSVDVNELYSQGMIGFMKGVQGFKPSKGVRLYTYAKYWIDAKVRRALEHHIKYENSNASLDDLAERNSHGIHGSNDGSASDAHDRVVSYAHEAYGGELPAVEYKDKIPVGLAPLCEDAIAEIAKSVDTFVTKNEFVKRHVYILHNRLLKDGEPESLESIGAKYGVSKENVRQSEMRLIKSLKKRIPVQIRKNMKAKGVRAVPVMEDLFGDYMVSA